MHNMKRYYCACDGIFYWTELRSHSTYDVLVIREYYGL